MRAEIRIPHMGANIDKAKILRWRKTVGERVEDLEPLVEVETSKAVLEIEAECGGTLVAIVHASGTFPIQTVIGYIETGR
jgi:pyruvate/2-oxoglutarate dehydrogenase complex dihydrolipoamide acyltransferase (E2) component